MSSIFSIKSASRTDIGCGRERNEDYMIEWMLKSRSTDAPHDGAMLAVADGIGGHNHGEVASRVSCELLATHIRELGGRPQTTKTFCTSMETIFRHINQQVIQEGETNSNYRGMGTTLSCLMLFAKYALVAHVGDSRIFRLRGNKYTQLSRDHTMIQELLDKDVLDEEQAKTHPYRHILTAAIGKDPDLKHVYTNIEKMQPGDRYLLVTGGLFNVVNNSRMEEILGYSDTPGVVCDRLVDEALSAKSNDNISVVAAFVEP
jgi:PPM family protein phosphatase